MTNKIKVQQRKRKANTGNEIQISSKWVIEERADHGNADTATVPETQDTQWVNFSKTELISKTEESKKVEGISEESQNFTLKKVSVEDQDGGVGGIWAHMLSWTYQGYSYI